MSAPPSEPQSPTLRDVFAEKSAWLRDASLRPFIGAVLAGVAIMLLSMWSLAPNRSFHQDELTNIKVMMKEAVGEELEPQHRAFHAFQQWWLGIGEITERRARVPSMVFVTLGLLAFCGLAGRLGGRWAVVSALAVGFFWPRLWDDGLEMRYYGFVFLCCVLAYHCALSFLRGATLWPVVALVLLLGALGLWHPTPLPFLAVLLAAMVVGSVVRLVLELKARPAGDAASTRAHLRKLAAAATVVLLSAAGAVWVFVEVLPTIGGSRIWQNLGKLGEGTWHGHDLVNWFMAWVDDRLAGDFILYRVLWISFPALVVLGFVELWKRERRLLVLLAGAGAVHVLVGGLNELGWGRIAMGYKYLWATGLLLMLAVALAIPALVALVREKSPRASTLALCAVAGLYFLPLLPRWNTSARGDGSNLLALWRDVERWGGDRKPLLYGMSTTTQSVFTYKYIKSDFPAQSINYHEIRPNIVRYLLDRDEFFFVAFPPNRLSRLDGVLDLLERRREYPSNFSENWAMEAYVPAGDHQLSSGRRLELAVPGTILFPCGGSWTVTGEGTLKTQAGDVRAGGVATLEDGELASADGALVLTPSFAVGPIVRRGAFAQSGPIDKYNRPLREHGRGIYRLFNNLTVGYDFNFPREPADLVIRTIRDEPHGANLLLFMNDAFVGFYTTPSTVEFGDEYEMRIPLPTQFAGKDVRIEITNSGETSVHRENAPDVGCFDLIELRIEAPVPGAAHTPDVTRRFPQANPPAWTKGGLLEGGSDGVEELFKALVEPTVPQEQRVTFERTREALVARLPEHGPDQIFGTPPFPAKPGEIIAVETNVRARSVFKRSLVPVIYFIDAKGSFDRHRQFSQLPIGRRDTDWTPRRTFVQVPEGTVSMMIGYYVNSAGIAVTRDDERFEIRDIRFFRRLGEHTAN